MRRAELPERRARDSNPDVLADAGFQDRCNSHSANPPRLQILPESRRFALIAPSPEYARSFETRRARPDFFRETEADVDPMHQRRGSVTDDSTGSPFAPRDACGVGFIARRSGERTHEVVKLALEASAMWWSSITSRRWWVTAPKRCIRGWRSRRLRRCSLKRRTERQMLMWSVRFPRRHSRRIARRAGQSVW